MMRAMARSGNVLMGLFSMLQFAGMVAVVYRRGGWEGVQSVFSPILTMLALLALAYAIHRVNHHAMMQRYFDDAQHCVCPGCRFAWVMPKDYHIGFCPRCGRAEPV